MFSVYDHDAKIANFNPRARLCEMIQSIVQLSLEPPLPDIVDQAHAATEAKTHGELQAEALAGIDAA